MNAPDRHLDLRPEPSRQRMPDELDQRARWAAMGWLAGAVAVAAGMIVGAVMGWW